MWQEVPTVRLVEAARPHQRLFFSEKKSQCIDNIHWLARPDCRKIWYKKKQNRVHAQLDIFWFTTSAYKCDVAIFPFGMVTFVTRQNN